jgi:adenylate cyclase
VKFIVSEFTKAKLGDEFVLRELDRVKVKGKDKPVTIFEVMGLSSDPRAAEWTTLAARFEEALNLYYAQNFAEASKIFWELDDQKLPTAEMYVKRCALWTQDPPPSTWDGSWTMKTK